MKPKMKVSVNRYSVCELQEKAYTAVLRALSVSSNVIIDQKQLPKLSHMRHTPYPKETVFGVKRARNMTIKAVRAAVRDFGEGVRVLTWFDFIDEPRWAHTLLKTAGFHANAATVKKHFTFFSQGPDYDGDYCLLTKRCFLFGGPLSHTSKIKPRKPSAGLWWGLPLTRIEMKKEFEYVPLTSSQRIHDQYITD